MYDFSPSNKLKTSILILQYSVLFVFTLGSPTLVKVNKAMKSGTLQVTLHSKVARRTKLHVVKSTDLHCILNKNINKCRRRNLRRGQKMPDPPLGNVFQLPRRRISRRLDWKTVRIFAYSSTYARAVKQKVGNEAENRERDWEEMLKIRTVRFAYVIFVRITRFSQPRAIPIG